MGLYNVVGPCVVGLLHYARPHAEPIEVDDDTAAPLVEDGSLTPYAPGVPGPTGTAVDGELNDVDEGVAVEPVDEAVEPRPRSRRKASED